MHYLRVAIFFLNTDSYKSAFPTSYFKNLVFCLSVFCIFCLFYFELAMPPLYNICLVNVYVTKSFVILFLFQYKLLEKNWCQKKPNSRKALSFKKHSIYKKTKKENQKLKVVWIWPHLLKKPLMENFIFCAMKYDILELHFGTLFKNFIYFILVLELHFNCRDRK